MNRKIILLLFFTVFIFFSAFSQKEKNDKKKSDKKKHSGISAIYVHVPVPLLKFTLKDAVNGNKLEFEPVPHYNLGIGIKLGGFNISVGTGIAVYKPNLTAKGHSQYRDIQIQINSKSFSHDFFYEKFQGVFISNTASYLKLPQVAPYILRPDLRFTLIGISSLYIVNSEKFSFKNTFGFTTLDQKIGASLLVGAYYSNLNQSGMTGLVNPEFKSFFDSTSYYRVFTEQTYGVKVGVGCMFIILKRIHLTLAAAEGFGVYDIKYTMEDGTSFTSPSKFSTKTSARANIGFDLGKIFIGGTAHFDAYNLTNKTFSTIDFSNAKIRGIIGYRLGKQRK